MLYSGMVGITDSSRNSTRQGLIGLVNVSFLWCGDDGGDEKGTGGRTPTRDITSLISDEETFSESLWRFDKSPSMVSPHQLFLDRESMTDPYCYKYVTWN